MKNVLLIIGILVACFQLSAKEKIEIPAGKTVALTYEKFAKYSVKISNKSNKQIDVMVINPATDRQVSGFGLGPLGNAVLNVAEGNILKLKNSSSKDISVTLSFVDRKPSKPFKPGVDMVQFTLHNSSLKSIPLVIPNVMNPNLSPMSDSGVSLERGQKIYLKKGLSKVLLFTVDDGIKNGDKIDVAKLVLKLNEE